MLTYEDEDDLLEDIREGVSIALERTGLASEGYVDDIKLNKLAYFAIQEYDLEITYGWFKYGPAPYFPDGTSGRGYSTVSPQSPDGIRASASSRVPTVDDRYLSPVEYSYFYTDDIPDEFRRVVTTDTKEYLVLFYDDHAPPTYRDLYKECARLQQTLDRIEENDEWLNDATTVYDELEAGLQATFAEMLRVDQVSESVSAFNDYKRLLKDVVITARKQGEISPEKQQFLEKLIAFFYGTTWEYTANLISRDTVIGANSQDLAESIEEDLQGLRGRHGRELNSLRERASAFDLLPQAVEMQDDLVEQEETLPPHQRSTEEIDAWSRLGAEVIRDDESE